jgi:hypothetical protein
MSSYSEKLYRYDTTIDLMLSGSTLHLDNRPMNNKKLKAHKGVTNTLLFSVTDKDRRPQNMFTDHVRAHIISPTNRRRLLTKKLEPAFELGKLTLLLTDGDLQNITSGLYHIYLTYSPDVNEEMPLYSDQNNNVKFEIEITEQVVMDPVATQEETSFSQTSSTLSGGSANVFVSDAMFGNLEKNFQNAQHSVAIYPEGYTGQVLVQASCISTTPNTEDTSKDWFTVKTVDLVNESNISHQTFSVNCNWVRVVSTPTSGTITKVLLRN